ncbi:hypothetical protein [Limnohabitans parvus]|nr:hypothetical protein [Limnohabitans parvus]
MFRLKTQIPLGLNRRQLSTQSQFFVIEVMRIQRLKRRYGTADLIQLAELCDELDSQA